MPLFTAKELTIEIYKLFVQLKKLVELKINSTSFSNTNPIRILGIQKKSTPLYWDLSLVL